MSEGEIPSLLSLCVDAVKNELVRGDDLLPIVKELPWDLLDALASRLPPLGLEKLQTAMAYGDWDDREFADEGLRNGRKRGRSWKFNAAWRNLSKVRWPELDIGIEPLDWQRIYWEMHLQNCLDAVAEIASLPSFDGHLSETRIPESILGLIGCEGFVHNSTCDCSELHHHCQQFGYYARCLRLQNVLCGAEISHLLRNSRLQRLELRWIRSKEHIAGLCKLLSQNSESLTSLELIHCKLSSASIDEICCSLSRKSVQTHGIKSFSISTSNFLETNPLSLPLGLVLFLSSGRSLYSLKLSDNHLGRNFAKMVFGTLINASSSLSILDLSDNNISGWLSELYWRSPSGPPIPLGTGKSLQSLRVLNLRGNNLNKDDVDGLRYALVHMPKLEVLDISDNSIEDDGIRLVEFSISTYALSIISTRFNILSHQCIRSLIPYFVEASEKCTPYADLMLESCELSCDGVTLLIDTLSTLKRPLKSLSVADNDLGSQVAPALGKILSASIQVLNVEGIGLGLSGFRELQDGITKDLKLVEINISKNRGGIEAAKFLVNLISRAPELVTVNVAYNLLPLNSLTIVCSAIKAAKGHLEHLDLRGNTWDNQSGYASMLADAQCNGKPVFILSSSQTVGAPYDDDP